MISRNQTDKLLTAATTSIESGDDDQQLYHVKSLWAIVYKRLLKNKIATVSLFIIIIIILACVIVPIISPYHFNNNDLLNSKQAPSAKHLLGTDENGRDILTRLFYGGRISLIISLAATCIEVFIGTVLGLISGFYGKKIDNFIMRLSEVFMSLPYLMIAITIIAVLSTPDPNILPALSRFAMSMGIFWNILLLVLVLSLLGWPSIARIVRGQVLSIRYQEYIEACEALGLRDIVIIFRHILPNCLSIIIVYATLSIASVILTETAMSFLGLGVDVITPTWGNMIQSARTFINLQTRWWMWLPPSLFIFISVMCFNLLGDGLRDALDPKMKN